MNKPNSIGKNDWQRNEGVAEVELPVILNGTKKMNTFELRRRSHYTQKGILPCIFRYSGSHLIIATKTMTKKENARQMRELIVRWNENGC